MASRIPVWLKRLAVVIVGFVLVRWLVRQCCGMAARCRGEQRSYSMTRRVYRRVNPAAIWAIERLGVGAHNGVLYHTGRSSGREYATPLCMVPTPEGYIVPATYGPETDWLRNLKATPQSRVVFDKATHETVAEVIDLDRAIEYAGGTPGCRCWEDPKLEELVVLRPAVADVATKTA